MVSAMIRSGYGLARHRTLHFPADVCTSAFRSTPASNSFARWSDAETVHCTPEIIFNSIINTIFKLLKSTLFTFQKTRLTVFYQSLFTPMANSERTFS